MSEITLTDLRSQAKEFGIPWSEVADCYKMLRRIEVDRRELPNEIRQTAWSFICGVGSKPFWRHGFASRFGRRVERSDYTAVPGYDLIHQLVQSQFGQYTGPDGEDRLFDFLFSPYERFPPAVELYGEALDLVAADAESQ